MNETADELERMAKTLRSMATRDINRGLNTDHAFGMRCAAALCARRASRIRRKVRR